MNERNEIHAQKNGKLSPDDRLRLAELLIKAGYTVRLTSKLFPGDKQKTHVIEFWTEGKQA